MVILLLAMVMATVVTKWVQDGRTDRAYAQKGMVSPRYQERLSRLEKAGAPTTRTQATSRGPLRQYLGELYADALEDLSERHRQKRQLRGPYVYDPGKPSLRERFSAAVVDEVADYKRRAGWSAPQPEPVTVPEVPEPVAYEPGTVTFDEHGVRVPLGPPVTPMSRNRVGDRYTDEYNGRVMEWDGSVWGPVCSRCDKPMDGHDGRGWLRCAHCGVRAVDDRPQRGRLNGPEVPSPGPHRIPDLPSPYADVDPEELYGVRGAERCAHCDGTGLNALGSTCDYCRGAGRYSCPCSTERNHSESTNTATTGGTTMTGEAVNYETTVAHITAAEEQVGTVAERLDGADQAVAELRGQAEQLSASLAAMNLDGDTMAGVNAALEALDPDTFADLYAKLDAAKAGLASARDNVISTYGDAAATVAVTGVDAQFLATA